PLEFFRVAEQATETFHGSIVAMSPLAAGAGVELEYEERGSGDAVLLVHDLAADHLTMLERVAGLGHMHVIAYARRGYGASGAPEPYAGTTVHEQAQDA